VIPVAAGVLVLLVLGAAATLQLTRALPDPVLRLTAPALTALPGKPVSLPWPGQGQAYLDIDGIGSPGGSGGTKAVPIGSIAKVMTAYLVLTHHPLTAGADGPTITITDADVADYQSRMATQQSQVAVQSGEQLTEREALEALLLPSANNIAAVLARWDAGSSDAFVATMNQTATALNLTGTRYTDPSGFDPATVSTAPDQVVLAERAMTLPAFAAIVALPTATIPVAGTVHNYNPMLGDDGVVGIKTGSTDQAGGNIVFAARATVAGHPITVYGAVLGQPGEGTDDQLSNAADAATPLLDAVPSLVRTVTVVPAGTRLGTIRTAWHQAIPVHTAAAVQQLGWPGLAVTTAVTTDHLGPTVHTGQHAGTLTVTTGATTPVRVAATAAGATHHPTTWWRLTRR
jgi:D-alanyl-D-alanine carboxypeptidase (penicillin-binding protein 5/6)